MSILKRFISFFIASAIALTSSSAWIMAVYAAVSTSTSPWVMSNKTVNSGDTVNYTKGMEVGYSTAITFKNDGVVNVTGGTFYMNSSSTFENNGTFSFDGSNATFSLGSTSTSFINNGTATIKGGYNFSIQEGTSFINNGTLYLEDISSHNLSGFVNNGIIIIPDDAKNTSLHFAIESKNGESGYVYTQTDFESMKIRYGITYEGLNADNYWDFDNSSNPVDYEWAAADPQDVTLADPTLGGYEFLGWTGLDVTTPTKNFTFSSSVRKKVTFTAHWQPIVYRINYDLDGGSFYTYQTPPAEYKRGDTKGIPRPHKDGYTFNGWIDTDSNQKVSTGNDNYYYMSPSILGDKTYKASFIANTDTQYKLICCYQNIDGTYTEEQHLFTGETGSQVSVSSEDHVKKGFYFDSGNSGNVTYGEIKADNSLELKLYFNRSRYTVIFKSQDGSETLWTTEKYYDEAVGEYGGDIPTKESDNDLYTFVFDNWAREEPNRDFGYDVSKVVVYEEITFYAAFKQVRDESVVVIKWEAYDGFVQPAQTEIRIDKGEAYTIELQLESENYYVGTREWTIGIAEGHVYWYDPQIGETGVDYTLDKADFDSPVVLTVPNVQHDTLIILKAHYHDEHDYSPAFDTVISNGSCETDSIIRHFCYKCGKTYDETVPAGGHVTGNSFETDNASHWKICSVCGENVGLEAHTPDTGKVTHEPTHNSTGTKTYTCTVCKYVTKREILPMIPHSAETDWQSNGNTHYKLCSCGERLDEAAHTPDNGTVTLAPTYDTEGRKEYRCTVCGYVLRTETILPLSHSTDGEWVSDNESHWKEGCGCGAKHELSPHSSDTGTVTIEPTYEAQGEKVYSCTVCGYVLRTETILPLSHSTEGEWVSDNESHWKEDCGCGEKHELSPHNSDTGTVTIEPTYEAWGEKVYSCTVCGYVLRTETILPLSHSTEGEWVSDNESHWKEGCGCGEKHELSPHSSDTGTVTIEPTYEAQGEKVYSCTVCGYVLRTETILPLSHSTEGEWVSDNESHWKEGCGCGAKHELSPHSSDTGTVTIEPTYEAQGEKVYSCMVCGYVLRTETILPLSHSTEGEWVSDNESHWKEDCGCGEKHELSPHNSDTGTVTIEPTYEAQGEKVYSCTVCGYVLRTETMLPLSHSTEGEWVSDNESHWKEGCDCGEKHELSPHNSDIGTVTLYPTASEEGKTEYRCTVCGYILKTEILPALGSGTDTPDEPSAPTKPSIPSYDNIGNYGGVQSDSFAVVPKNPRKAFKVRFENKITGKNGKATATRTGENVKVNVGRGNDKYYANVCSMDGNVLYAVEIKSGKAKFKIQPDIDFYIVIDKNSYLEYEDVSSAAGVYERSDDIKKSERIIIPQIMYNLIKKLCFMLRTA